MAKSTPEPHQTRTKHPGIYKLRISGVAKQLLPHLTTPQPTKV